MPSKAKLTIRTIEAVKPGSQDVIIWDTEVPGFGCKVTPAGKRVFFLYYRTRDGRQRRPSIGVFGAIKPEKAREIAKQWSAEIASGSDPSAARSASREAPTVRALCRRYLEEHASTRKRLSSLLEDTRLIEKRIAPALGDLKVASVQRADVTELHNSLSGTPYEANRVLSLLSKMFALAERWGLRIEGANPARNIDRFPERKRERFLSVDELRRLSSALDAEEAAGLATEGVIPAIRLLVLTGCRLSEITKLEWRHVDVTAGVLRLPDSKTGAKLVYLSIAAADLLKRLRLTAPQGVYVCAGRKAGKPLVNLQKPWRRIRSKANLADVRLHDLRHTYASLGASEGLSLPMIGKLLGHTHSATTARYAHLADDPVRQSAELIGGKLAIAFGPLPAIDS